MSACTKRTDSVFFSSSCLFFVYSLDKDPSSRPTSDELLVNIPIYLLLRLHTYTTTRLSFSAVMYIQGHPFVDSSVDLALDLGAYLSEGL